jgi:UDP-2-acetamido-3-amino-2,3-dideoxy-glucuronate N-acetyltransferase
LSEIVREYSVIMGANAIACIGGGYWGKNLIRNFSDLGVLAWICELDAERRSHLGATYPTAKLTDDMDQALADPEVAGVAIATPAETHGALVRQALLSGKDVLVEKPLCLSVEEGQQLVDLASKKRRVLMVGHLLWYYPAVLRLQALIAEGELGRIQHVYSTRLNL